MYQLWTSIKIILSEQFLSKEIWAITKLYNIYLIYIGLNFLINLNFCKFNLSNSLYNLNTD
jgi:hypothetical protein